MNRSTPLLVILLLCTILPLISQENGCDFSLWIYQNSREILPDGRVYSLRDGPFQLVMEGVDPEDAVAIFAYPTNEMFNRYSYPIRTADTVMFAPATGLAMYENKEKAYYLSMNREGTHNYMSTDRRINEAIRTTLNVLGFQTIEGRQLHLPRVCLTIFIDSDQNRIIDSNEIRHIILQWDQAGKKQNTPGRDKGKN